MPKGRALMFDERPDFASQHRQMEILIGGLALYEGKPADDNNLRILLESLVAFTRMHFMMEEQYMRARGFPGLDSHREAHRLLLERIEDFRKRLSEKEVAFTRQKTAYLHAWQTDHVNTMDAEYEEFVAGELLPEPVAS